METIGLKVCRRCLKEKTINEFFNDDRGNWCMLCNYEFLLAYGDDPIYMDAREFTHPDFRGLPRSSAWVLQKMREGLQKCDLLPCNSKLDFQTARGIQGGRFADASRLPGERALICEECNEKFGGKTVFKAHRKYGTSRGRPGPNAVLKCYSLEDTKYHKDEKGVWRNRPIGLPVRKI